MTRVVGFAVAGGQSRRMRKDKALLAWSTSDLLDHALARLRAVTPDVRILCGAELRYADRGVPVLPDLVPDAGSLGGVHTGLEALAQLGAGSGEDDAGLFLGIDLPFVTVRLLARLVALADGFDAVVPVSPGGPEPLAALYRPACLPPIRQCMAEGRFEMTAFWSEARVRTMEGDELRSLGEPTRLFRNLNTRADYEQARREAAAAGRD
jgi:molybdopterin-guanine dinucleotide biosynthesis protein A